MNPLPQYLAAVWEGLSTIRIPYINISATSLFLGILIIGISVRLLNLSFGVGNTMFHRLGAANRRRKSKLSKSNREQEEE